MPDRSRQDNERPDAPANDGDVPARSIPDGGLGSAMPDWLRQPPAWQRPPVTAHRRELPPPDTSVIDPATMIDLDDLPTWLRDLAKAAAPVAETPLAIDQDAVAVARVVDTRYTKRAPAERPASPEPSSPPVLEPAAPPDAGPAPDRPIRAQPAPESTQAVSAAWWLSDKAIGALLLAVVLTMIYVILVATGVL